jgi:hypothetical protein
MTESQITADAYEPVAELRALLDDELADVRVSYPDGGEGSSLGERLDGNRRSVRVTLGEDWKLTGIETYSEVGVLLSVSGNLGFAAAVVLSYALRLGEPALVYVDDAPAPSAVVGRYQDLSVEWYTPAAVEAGVPTARRQRRGIGEEQESLSLETVEHYARVWLDAGP